MECYLLRNLSLSKQDHSLFAFLQQDTDWPTQGPEELIHPLNWTCLCALNSGSHCVHRFSCRASWKTIAGSKSLTILHVEEIWGICISTIALLGPPHSYLRNGSLVCSMWQIWGQQSQPSPKSVDFQRSHISQKPYFTVCKLSVPEVFFRFDYFEIYRESNYFQFQRNTLLALSERQ